MNEFSKKDIDTFLTPVTDITLDLIDLESSYVYIKSSGVTKEFKEHNENEKKTLNIVAQLVIEQSLKLGMKKDFQIAYNGHYFRCNVINSIAGKLITCRHMPFNFIQLHELGLPESIMKEMMHERLNKGGLIFICGSPGQGKSTTTAALIDARLRKYSGLCIAIEDPVEIPLHGKHGEGRCIQVPVETTFRDSIRDSMRSYPTGQNNLLFLGEVRDADTAVNAIRSAIDGRLVITTFHTDNIINAFERLISLASIELSEDEAYSLVAETFRFGLHQRLVKGNKIVIRTNVLVDTQEVYSNIREKRLNHLQNERERQFLLLKSQSNLNYRQR